MSIERVQSIQFHLQGTLNAVTSWISSHDQGIAEWLKNARRAYQDDRANVAIEHRAAVLLLRDAGRHGAARIGLLDVGGASYGDFERWWMWQDPRASDRNSGIQEEQTQGNGGKAYMFRLFAGSTRFFGIRDNLRNCMGFDGPALTEVRGSPGFMPNRADGYNVPIGSVLAELRSVLSRYDLRPDDLPSQVQTAIERRSAFTLVEGEDPTGLYRGRLDADELVARVLRNEQSTLVIEQLALFAFHNGRSLTSGRPLELPQIEAYPGLEGPYTFAIPELLDRPDGPPVSSTRSGESPPGRLHLHTSRQNMPNAHKNFKPRWRISYRTQHQMIGAKPVSDYASGIPGSHFVYGTVELAALEPDYVDHGRRRPKDGPLVAALDQFITDKIREVAKLISDRRRREQDSHHLDAVQIENQRLDEFKNRFLANDATGDGGTGDDGLGPGGTDPRPPTVYGDVPVAIQLRVPTEAIRVGCGVSLHVTGILWPSVRDAEDQPVKASIAWHCADTTIAHCVGKDLIEARGKGKTEIWATVDVGRGSQIESERVPFEVWSVDHVLLTPRKLEIPLGRREKITAEVTDDDGQRSTDVILEWRHDADDPQVVRISPTGFVTANRIGRTAVTAGAGAIDDGGVWARIPVDVHVVPNPQERKHGGGFPKLLVTDRDTDPATGLVRAGDPDSPALWQETSDYVNNVWWLNLQSAEAAFAFGQRDSNPTVWRNFHIQIVMEMVIQVHMQTIYTRSSNEQPDYWAIHRGAMDTHRANLVPQMWESFEAYVRGAGDLD